MADVHELIAQSGFIGPVPDATVRKFERFAELVRAEERALNARALEFAEYMAKGAENFQEIVAVMASHYVEDEEEPPQHVLDSFGDRYSGLNNDIYEFRKRAAAIRADAGEGK